MANQFHISLVRKLTQRRAELGSSGSHKKCRKTNPQTHSDSLFRAFPQVQPIHVYGSATVFRHVNPLHNIEHTDSGRAPRQTTLEHLLELVSPPHIRHLSIDSQRFTPRQHQPNKIHNPLESQHQTIPDHHPLRGLARNSIGGPMRRRSLLLLIPVNLAYWALFSVQTSTTCGAGFNAPILYKLVASRTLIRTRSKKRDGRRSLVAQQ